MDPVVQLGSQGASLQGKAVCARGSDTKVHGFLGIPYAEPPVGELRFRPPKELRLWTGIRDATEYGPACPQDRARVMATYGHLPNLPSSYSEDCLYLNVWAPQDGTPGHGNRAVLVWVHGGAFVQGFSNIYDGTALAAYENVVVVSINYRLGVFGFLRTGSGANDYHGNQGLLDQLEALRWVQKYIHYFGGDPHNVTIMGESAGAISISTHQISPLARGLFRRSIVQSGPILTANGVWMPRGVEKYFYKRLQNFGFNGNTSQDLTRFLATKSTQQCLDSFNEWFVPIVIDGSYLPDQPLVLYNKGLVHQVDSIIGFNTSEGATFVLTPIQNSTQARKFIEQVVSLNFFRGQPKPVIDKIAELAKDLYVGGLDGDANFHEAISDLYGDVAFVAPSILQARLHSRHGSTYVYEYDHRPFYSRKPGWVRADHAEEIAYMFGMCFLQHIPDVYPEPDKDTSRRMMKYWANFAKTGNPNGSSGVLWPQYNDKSPQYLPIQSSEREALGVTDYIPERIRLWNSVVPQIVQGYSKSKY